MVKAKNELPRKALTTRESSEVPLQWGWMKTIKSLIRMRTSPMWPEVAKSSLLDSKHTQDSCQMVNATNLWMQNQKTLGTSNWCIWANKFLQFGRKFKMLKRALNEQQVEWISFKNLWEIVNWRRVWLQ
jgi:hypothetical protein